MALTELLGVRVVRGPDWPSSSNEDGGEGFVGTVVEKATGDAAGGDVAEAASASRAEGERLVVVQWDVGTRGSYRCGEQGKYDLRILDVAPAGFHHSGVECSSCSTPLIHGLRWQCLDCKGYNLCSECYTTDRHDSNHCFCVFTRDNSCKFDVAKRAGARLITSQGAFPGAEVCLLPFPDGRKDEADRAVGSVVEICSDDADRPRSMVCVEWLDGAKQRCSLGKLDLRCVKTAEGPQYYSKHLPPLGWRESGQPEGDCQLLDVGEEDLNTLAVGRLVQLTDIEYYVFESFQQHVQPWDRDLQDMTFVVGVVKQIKESSNGVEVFFKSVGKSYVLHSALLSVIPRFSPGTQVSVLRDVPDVTKMMRRLPKSIEGLLYIGNTGSVLKYDDDDNVVVRIGSRDLLLHPGCIQKARSEMKDGQPPSKEVGSGKVAFPPDAEPSGTTASGDKPVNDLMKKEKGLELVNSLLKGQHSVSSSDGLAPEVKEAFTSAMFDHDVKLVEQMLEQFPKLCHARYGHPDSTAVHIAVDCGNMVILKILHKHGCSLDARDGFGIPPIHIAAARKEVSALRVLVELGAKLDGNGENGAYALHLACEVGCRESVKTLLRFGHQIDCLDCHGETPLHSAIKNDHAHVVDVLLRAGASMHMTTRKGFKAPHHAALSNSVFSLPVILKKAPSFLNEAADSNDHTLLHIAATNNWAELLVNLLKEPNILIDPQDKNCQTPLAIAVSRGARACVEQLLAYGARTDIPNSSGNTPLHIALSIHYPAVLGNYQELNILMEQRDPPAMAENIDEIQRRMPYPTVDGKRFAAIACFLAQQGGSLTYLNFFGQSPLSGCVDDLMKGLLESHYIPAGSLAEAVIELDRKLYPTEVFCISSSGKTRMSDFHGSKSRAKARLLRVKEARLTSRADGGDNTALATSKMEGGVSSPKQETVRVAASSLHPAEMSEADAKLGERFCRVRACTNLPDVTFRPCGHQITCKDCCVQFNMCPVCMAVVDHRLSEGKEVLAKMVVIKPKYTVSKARRAPPPAFRLACVFQTPYVPRQSHTSPKEASRNKGRPLTSSELESSPHIYNAL